MPAKFIPGHGLHSMWLNMMYRCQDVTNLRYGGRGIRVCQRWHDYKCFMWDMGPKPTKYHSIDRINNDGNYSCGKCLECIRNKWAANCRWATGITQARNTSANVNIAFGGETMCISAWSERVGFREGVINYRLKRGWTAEQALTIPLRGKRL